MPETADNRRIFSLAEVARSIQKTISERYRSTYWVKAEINKLNLYPHSGHCYPELLEKREGKVVAEMRGTLWKADYERINRVFLDVVREPLKDGITVLMECAIQFDPLYGFSLKILDIDSNFALGQLEREKQESIALLKKEGVFDANKRLPFPLVPKRLAIISVESSKGYSDFMQVVQRNPWGYRLEWDLYPALLQGDKAVDSIRRQLTQIASTLDRYDVVLIIRGGGGEVGLASYNNVELAGAIARFPVPVLTGIGHSTNETVSEMVAYKSAITPTELADFLIQRYHEVAEALLSAGRVLCDRVPALLQVQQVALERMGQRIRSSSQIVLKEHAEHLVHAEWKVRVGAQEAVRRQEENLRSAAWKVEVGSQRVIQQQKQVLEGLSKQIDLMNPERLLERGYSMTLDARGKVLLSTDQVQVGEVLVTRLANGELRSQVLEKKVGE